jgi:hypothetical protein
MVCFSSHDACLETPHIFDNTLANKATIPTITHRLSKIHEGIRKTSTTMGDK